MAGTVFETRYIRDDWCANSSSAKLILTQDSDIAQIFLNLITHSLWSITKVSLMIFDECHHARKNHPYNGIMREYFHVAPDCRPKIFGMTASPVWNPKDPAGSLADLEANLDSKVIGVRAHIDELTEHTPKPVEVSDFRPLNRAFLH